jgi:hypothetical protein
MALSGRNVGQAQEKVIDGLRRALRTSAASLTLSATWGAEMRRIGYPVFELFFGALLLVAALLAIFKTVVSLVK